MIYSGSINDQLSKTTTARIHQATNEITRLYDAKIAAAQKEIAAVQGKEASLQRQVTNSRFLSECEAGETSCSQTHKLGCGPYCKRDARRAAAAAAALKTRAPAVRGDDRRRPAQDRALAAAETTQVANRVAAIKADRDFLSRQAALDRVEKANPAVRKYVEFFLAFLIAIDLVALVLKLTHLFSTGGAYERSAAALRAMDVVEAHRLQERAAVLTRRITLEARAEEEADELRIRGEVKREPGRAETVASCRPVGRAHLIHSAAQRPQQTSWASSRSEPWPLGALATTATGRRLLRCSPDVRVAPTAAARLGERWGGRLALYRHAIEHPTVDLTACCMRASKAPTWSPVTSHGSSGGISRGAGRPAPRRGSQSLRSSFRARPGSSVTIFRTAASWRTTSRRPSTSRRSKSGTSSASRSTWSRRKARGRSTSSSASSSTRTTPSLPCTGFSPGFPAGCASAGRRSTR